MKQKLPKDTSVSGLTTYKAPKLARHPPTRSRSHSPVHYYASAYRDRSDGGPSPRPNEDGSVAAGSKSQIAARSLSDRSGSGNRVKRNQLVVQEGEEIVSIDIRGDRVGWILGRKQITVAGIRRESKCRVDIVKNDTSNVLDEINLIGRTEAIALAKHMIFEILNDNRKMLDILRAPSPSMGFDFFNSRSSPTRCIYFVRDALRSIIDEGTHP